MSQYSSKGLFIPIEDGAFRATNAIVTGDVVLAEDVGIWFGCVLRGDDAQLKIGARSNVQDLTMVHADIDVPNVIGEEVTVGHGCVLHGAKIGNRCLIGMGAVLLAGSVVGDESIVAAGAVVRENFEIPPRTLVAGVPAKIIRAVTDDEVESIRESAAGYVKKLRIYLA
ncbi:MAG: carbonic anhydrase/acetyltransferase-like protein (isoleucine patch superfamily) [Planctomycetota bacterium]|jgi:carbonic anhydrase/acetyltransferase-like protein (isoleucine patch superfamily)